MKRKLIAFVIMLTVGVSSMWADANAGSAAIGQAATSIGNYEQPVSNLMKAIALVIAVVGAFNIYFKMQNGDQDVKKTVMLTLGGCIAFVVLSEALPQFFK